MIRVGWHIMGEVIQKLNDIVEGRPVGAYETAELEVYQSLEKLAGRPDEIQPIIQFIVW